MRQRTLGIVAVVLMLLGIGIIAGAGLYARTTGAPGFGPPRMAPGVNHRHHFGPGPGMGYRPGPFAPPNSAP
jgi:hypothetical protein